MTDDKIIVSKRPLSKEQNFLNLIDLLKSYKFDIVYINKLHGFTDDDRRYFNDQLMFIENGIAYLEWYISKDNKEAKRKKIFGIF